MINLLYAGNSGVLDGIMTSILSVFKRTETKEPFRIIIYTMDLTEIKGIYTPISDVEGAFLDSLAKRYNPENRVELVDVTDLYHAGLAKRVCLLLAIYVDKTAFGPCAEYARQATLS